MHQKEAGKFLSIPEVMGKLKESWKGQQPSLVFIKDNVTLAYLSSPSKSEGPPIQRHQSRDSPEYHNVRISHYIT